MSGAFSADWLALREPFDRIARARTLAARLVQHLPPRPRIIDLGAGTASLFRWLAPMIGRAQAWTIVDADAALLGEAFARTADWAEARGWRLELFGRDAMRLKRGEIALTVSRGEVCAVPTRLPADAGR